MWKALVLKELREVALIAGLGLVALFYFLALAIGCNLPNWSTTQISDVPFVRNDPFTGKMGVVLFCLAVALALSQSYLESLRGTWLWLLHRPISRTRLVAVKLLVGTTVYLLCAAPPILCYAWWAATPGAHAGPFEWSMTAGAWRTCVLMLAIYSGAFLSGVYPGRWFGTRLLPLIGVGILATIALLTSDDGFSPAWRPWAWPAFVLLIASCVYAILHVVHTRDFS